MPLSVRVLRFCALCLSLAPVFCNDVPARSEDGEVVERFKVEKDGNDLLVPVQVGGKEYLFSLDTGSTYTVIDRTLLTGKPKYEADIRSTHSGCPYPLFDVPPAAIGHCELQKYLARPRGEAYLVMSATESQSGLAGFGQLSASGQPWIDPREESGVLGIDLSPFREASGREMYGIIGMDFLHHFVLQIDFDQGEARLLRKVAPPERADSFKLYYSFEGLPLVHCGLCGYRESDFLLDTGCDGSGGLEAYTASDLVEHGYGRPISSARYQTGCGEVTAHLFRVGSFALGSHLVHELTFSDDNENRLGRGYLSRFEVTFDFPNKLLYVSEGNGFDKPDLTNVSGLHLVRKDGTTVVHWVEPDSAAESSGLEEGDVVLKVDDLEADKTALKDLRRGLCGDDRTVHVAFERDGEQCEAEIELK